MDHRPLAPRPAPQAPPPPRSVVRRLAVFADLGTGRSAATATSPSAPSADPE